MTTITTLSEFLLQAGTEYRVYDMGRGIRHLPAQAFIDIEHGKQPYPYPRQAHAWIGIIFWNKNLSNEHYIWFLKLAVDETSTLISAARDHFLHLVVEALEKETENTSETLSQVKNPYGFTPSQQTLADFNALIKATLNLEPSRHYRETVQFLSAPSVMNWQLLASQGISDFCSRLSDGNNTQILVAAYANLAPTVKHALLSSLENYELNEQLAKTLVSHANAYSNDVNLMALTLRALAQSQHHLFVQNYVLDTVKSDQAIDINIVSVIVARHWQMLVDESLLITLLERAAAVSTDVCAGLYKDLVMIPLMRQRTLDVLNREAKHPLLAECLALLKRGSST